MGTFLLSVPGDTSNERQHRSDPRKRAWQVWIDRRMASCDSPGERISSPIRSSPAQRAASSRIPHDENCVLPYTRA